MLKTNANPIPEIRRVVITLFRTYPETDSKTPLI